MLSLPIGWMEFLFPKTVGHHFGPGLIPGQKLGNVLKLSLKSGKDGTWTPAAGTKLCGHSKFIGKVRKTWHQNPLELVTQGMRFQKTGEKSTLGVIAGRNCRIAFPYLDSTLGPTHLFLKEDGIIINGVWSLPCPQHTCTNLHPGNIYFFWTLQKDISTT